MEHYIVTIEANPDSGIESFVCDFDDLRDRLRREIRYQLAIGNTNISELTRIQIHKMTGIWQWIERYCPNRKIVHLMNHGRSYRVRLKNLNRGLRLTCLAAIGGK